ncbi:MAG TPA: hypothetical protein VMH86_06955 [Rhizomicrobium sp.]|nr:hypothetical protein [Rhizomicrobium sp.]
MKDIREGFDVVLRDGDVIAGAVRKVVRDGFLVYVEGAGDFVVQNGAVKEVHDGRVVLDPARLSPEMRAAVRHAHDTEDPNVADET